MYMYVVVCMVIFLTLSLSHSDRRSEWTRELEICYMYLSICNYTHARERKEKKQAKRENIRF